MNRPFIVGLCGPAGCGKSSIARAYAEAAQRCIATAFAAPLYALAAQLVYGDATAGERLRDELTKERPWEASGPWGAPIPSLIGWTPRRLLQVLGTECVRQRIGNNAWVELALASAERHGAAGVKAVVFEDVRFDNEAAACDLVVEVNRPGVDYAADHPSAYRISEDLIHRLLPNIDTVAGAVNYLASMIAEHRTEECAS